ncbi:MAG: HAD-IA family hydrolase [Methylacidiphilales bacterium]|nr:HAD-IA family hydrolase [Candidatus Methylacidiphilales bacterium]
MANSKIQFALFDLDGTLLDSNASLNTTLNLLLAKNKQSPVAEAETKAYVSGGAGAMIKLACPELSDIEIEKQRQEFFKIYRENLFYNTVLFEGVEELITQLKKRKIKIGIATNKQSEFTLPILTYLGIDKCMDAIVCRDNVSVGKPDPEMIYQACTIAEVTPNQCIFTGDDKRDIEAGRSAGVITVLAAYGYAPIGESIQWNANFTIQSPIELLALI